MKTYGGGGTAPPILTSALDGGQWSDSRPDRFTPGEIGPGTHRIGGWVKFLNVSLTKCLKVFHN
jgi:hypothetical protein